MEELIGASWRYGKQSPLLPTGQGNYEVQEEAVFSLFCCGAQVLHKKNEEGAGQPGLTVIISRSTCRDSILDAFFIFVPGNIQCCGRGLR